MTKQQSESICEAVFEFTRLQLAEHLDVLTFDNINDLANAGIEALQDNLRPYVR